MEERARRETETPEREIETRLCKKPVFTVEAQLRGGGVGASIAGESKVGRPRRSWRHSVCW